MRCAIVLVVLVVAMALIPNRVETRPQGDPNETTEEPDAVEDTTEDDTSEEDTTEDDTSEDTTEDTGSGDDYSSPEDGSAYGGNSTSDTPTWQNGSKFEGDMDLSPKQMNRNGDPDPSHRWPNAIIPYVFAPGHFDNNQQNYIRDALRQFDSSCVRIVPRQSQPNYVYITRYGTGCHSKIGYMASGPQQLNLQYDNDASCLTSGTVVHEFLHAAGFFHQQSATERDNYVNIDLSNVDPDYRHNFNKYNSVNFGVQYDYSSVMHYNNYAFALDQSRPTIWAKSNPNLRLGQDNGMTSSDLLKLRRMYNCG